MRVSVIGLGYLGAVTAASLASLGHKVLAIDRDEERSRYLSRGVLMKPISKLKVSEFTITESSIIWKCH